jgi:hypothetical protein
MKEDKKQSLNEAECGNKSKPLLCAGRIINTKFNLKTKWKF